MLTRLGSGPAPEDAVGMLLECHGRIREFVGMARRLAAARGEDAQAVRDAAGRVRRYFTDALPLHAQDEEESVLPRLRGREAGLDRELEAMAGEHRQHEEPLARLVEACGALERDPAQLANVGAALGAAAAELEAAFARHLDREESIIFPAVRRTLSPADDEALVREIRARRGGGGGPPAR